MYHLTEKHSFPFVSSATIRHIHISMQVPGGDKYANRIQPIYNDFLAKMTARENALQVVAFATDTVWLFDGYLDDELRRIKGRCEEYDNLHAGSSTVTYVFPDGNISGIIREDVEIEPSKAHEVSLKIAALGAEHELFPLAAELQTAADNSTAKITLRKSAENLYKDANVAAVLAKVAVVNQYNANFFAAGNDLNKKYAESLFPKLSPPPKDDEAPI